MLQKDITVGSTYQTRISGALVDVRVERQTEIRSFRSDRVRVGFIVKRLDSGRELPKPRTAAALRRPLPSRQETAAALCLALGCRAMAHGVPFVATLKVVRFLKAVSR